MMVTIMIMMMVLVLHERRFATWEEGSFESGVSDEMKKREKLNKNSRLIFM